MPAPPNPFGTPNPRFGTPAGERPPIGAGNPTSMPIDYSKPGTTSPNPNWMDQTQPGVGEQFFQNTQQFYQPGASQTGQWWGQNQQQFGQPTASEGFYTNYAPAFQQPGQSSEYWNGVQGSFAGPHNVANNSQGAYGDVKSATPNLMADPGLGSYYNDAERRTTQALDQNFAARGAYGSSVSQGQTADAVRGLEADRAKNEANYQLARSAEQRGWQGLDVQAAGQADASSLNASKNNLDWLSSGGILAGMSDKSALDRLMGLGSFAGQATDAQLGREAMGMRGAAAADAGEMGRLTGGQGAANTAEGLRNDRVQTGFQDTSGFANALSALAGQTYSPMFGQDQQLLDSILGGGIGGASQDLNFTQQNQAQIQQQLADLLNFAKSQGFGGLKPDATGGAVR